MFDVETSDDNDDEKTSKRCCSTSFELFLAEKFCSFWASFSALQSKIAISFDKMIKKSKTIAIKTNFFSIIVSARKIFYVVFSIETLKSEVSKSEIIEKRITKNEKNIETMSKRHLQEFEKESKKVTSIKTSSMLFIVELFNE